MKEARDVKETALGEQKLHFAEKEQEILDRIHTIRQHGLSDLKEKVVSVAVNTTADIFFHSCTKKQSDAFMENGLKELELVLTQNTEKDRLLQAVKND